MNEDGKYDAECEAIQAALDARAVVLLVLDGDRGNGFSVCVASSVRDLGGAKDDAASALGQIARVLRQVVAQMESQPLAAIERGKIRPV